MIPIDLDINGSSPLGTQKLVFAEDQPEYDAVPAIRTADGQITSRWKLDDRERALLLHGGADVYLTIHTFSTPAYAKGHLSRFGLSPVELSVK